MEPLNSSEFYEMQFNVDDYLNKLSDGKKLQEILDALVTFKAENADLMANVLKEQTDSVVSIAEELQNMSAKLIVLNAPTAQFKEEILVLQRRLEAALKISTDMAESESNEKLLCYNLTSVKGYNEIMEQTRVLISNYVGGASTEYLDRLINQYSFHNQLIKCLGTLCENIHHDDMNDNIKKLLREGFLSSIRRSNYTDLLRMRELFINTQLGDYLLEIIRVDIVKPVLEPILCEHRLKEKHGNLEALYQEALKPMTEDFNLVKSVITEDPLQYNLVYDGYWYVADQLMTRNLTSITQAGHSDTFRRNYALTKTYLEAVALLAGDKNLILSDNTFVNHLKRFDLLVYHELRHQEVCTLFETAINDFSDSTAGFYTTASNSTKKQLKLQVSIVYDIQQCFMFNDAIFLIELSDQFLKSSLLLTARYTAWLSMALERSHANIETDRKRLLLSVLNDVALLKKEYADKAHTRNVYAAVDKKCQPIAEDIMAENRYRFEECYNSAKAIYIKMIMSEVLEHLQQVTAIPRLYRRTNRSSPTERSSYVVQALKPIQQTIQGTGLGEDALLDEHRKGLLIDVTGAIANEYAKLIKEVLDSVCKTEESLRRLKNRIATSSDDTKSSRMTDESKIRLQIKYDILYFIAQIKGVTHNGIMELEEFLDDLN